MEKKRKKRCSSGVSIGFVAVTAALVVSGCDSGPASQRVCTNNGVVTADSWCEDNEREDENGRTFMRRPGYNWYYYPPNSAAGTNPVMGQRVSGGSYMIPASGRVVSRTGSVVRGGFGGMGGRGFSS